MKNKQKIATVIKIAITLIVVGFILCVDMLFNQNNKEIDENAVSTNGLLEMELLAYRHAELGFTKITAEEANAKIENGDTFFLYIGRATCQWCRKIAPSLSIIVKESEIQLFYLNSENTENDSVLSEFRATFGIKTVPSIIYFRGKGDYYTFELNLTENKDSEIEKNLREQFDLEIEDKR